MANENAKLSSFFSQSNKNFKKKTINANNIIQTCGDDSKSVRSYNASKNPYNITSGAKGIHNDVISSELSSRSATDSNTNSRTNDTKNIWSKQQKKAKPLKTKKSIPRSAAEYEEQKRDSRHLHLDSQKAFPTLGVNAKEAQLMAARAPKAKSITSTNVWSALTQDDDDDED